MTMKPLQQLAKAQDGKRKSDLNIISKALEDYLNDNPCYPSESPIEDCGGTGFRPYLSKIPCDPQTRQPYEYVRVDCKKYALYAILTTENLEINYNQKGNYVVSSPDLVIPLSQGAVQRNELPTESPTSPPEATPTEGQANYYGCFSNVCTSIGKNPYCSPNYLSIDCYGQCSNSNNECR